MIPIHLKSFSMRSFNRLCVCSLVSLASTLFADAYETTTIRFADPIVASTVSAPIDHNPILSKSERVSSNSGEIQLIYDQSCIPDSMLISVKAAAEYWESKIQTINPIKLLLDYTSLDDNLSFLCDVVYFRPDDSHGNTTFPSALYRQKENIEDTDFDAVITFNNLVHWTCGHHAIASFEGVNVYSSMLRAIAVCLGFGSTVSTFNGQTLEFQEFDDRSPFDKLTFTDSGLYLSDIATDDSESIENFATGQNGNVFILNNSPEYKLYTPDVYDFGKSLIYLENETSLMHHNIPFGDKRFRIDSITTNVLMAIGWNEIISDTDDIQIKGVGIENSGLASAYSSHEFIYESTIPVSDPAWTFKLTKKSGEQEIISESNESSFLITAISNPSNYLTTIDGDIRGVISFECTSNGKRFKADDYIVRLELKPVITKIHNLKVIPNGRYRDLSCMIEYTGADYVTAALEVDMSSSWRTFHLYEPFYAHLSIPGFSLSHDAWLDITVRNQYGSTTETLELPGSYITTARSDASSNTKIQSINCNGPFAVYTLDGIFLGVFESINNIESKLKTGIYLIVVKSTSEQIVKKIVLP